ncbi:MAG: DUF4139 domain-containing protein [Candidatus Omnitrophica bacterium]|nr:DUF4139 domain-containing protein [Candidatus Omnitrophota bacterium]
MKNLLIILLIALFPAACSAEDTQTPKTVVSSGHSTALSVTIYNQDLALISDHRQANLGSTNGIVEFADVPSGVIPESVLADTSTGTFAILSQIYEANLIDSNRLLESRIGKTIKIIDFNPYQDSSRTVEAEVLSVYPEPVYRIDGQIYLGHPGTRVLPSLPDTLRLEPAFVWNYRYSGTQPATLDVSYLTSGFSWKSDYTLRLKESASEGVLSAWATITNSSGADFERAELTLVAGSPNRSHRASAPQPRMLKQVAMADAAFSESGAVLSESAAFEYHTYSMPRPVSLRNAQTRQLRLFEDREVRFRKEFRLEAPGSQFFGPAPAPQDDEPLQVVLVLSNTDKDGLGLPLPAGTVRVYEDSGAGDRLFAGESDLPHTAENATAELRVGRAFDVTAKKTQTSYTRLSTRLHESSWEVLLKNRKPAPVEVVVTERFYQNWQLISSTVKPEMVDAFTAKFRIRVEPESETRLEYRVKVGLE